MVNFQYTKCWHTICFKLQTIEIKKTVVLRISTWLVFSLLVTGAFAQDTYDIVKKGDKAPEFTVKTINGKTVCLKELKGKYVLVNFFATWCKPCMEEMPLMEKKIHQKYSNDDIVVIAIGREHNIKELELFNQQKKFTFHIAADPKRSIYNLYAKKYIPRNYLISPNGILIYAQTGFKKSKFSKLIQLIDNKIAP